MSQTDESVFEVGRNVATTEGAVVFENELFQLIEYKPLTAKVHERPMLFVPPCINKFYILDLQPENSLIRYTVEQGHRVFVVSWRNPDESLADKTWDDYIEDGADPAPSSVVQAISGAEADQHAGLLRRRHASWPPRWRCWRRAASSRRESLTLLTTLLDFKRHRRARPLHRRAVGAAARDDASATQAPNGPALLKGKELATTFSFLRPNDLVWNYVVGNYLKGEAPPPFDLLYWNGDCTNLPGPMYCWYLRHTYLQNELKQPGKLDGLRREGRPRQRSRRRSSSTARARTTSCRGTRPTRRHQLLQAASAASCSAPRATSPASSTRRQEQAQPLDQRQAAAPSAEAWLASATEKPGSWWTDWSAWLKPHAGKHGCRTQGAAATASYKAIEPAPGRYVKAEGLKPSSLLTTDTPTPHRSRGHHHGTDIVIVAAARTAVGKFGGTLAKTPAPELGATVIKALLERAGSAATRSTRSSSARCCRPAPARTRRASR